MEHTYTFVDIAKALAWCTQAPSSEFYTAHPKWDNALPTFTCCINSIFEHRTVETIYCHGVLRGVVDIRVPHQLDMYAQTNGNIVVRLSSMLMPTDIERELKLNARNKTRISKELLAAKLISYHEYVGMLEFNGCLTQENLHPELATL